MRVSKREAMQSAAATGALAFASRLSGTVTRTNASPILILISSPDLPVRKAAQDLAADLERVLGTTVHVNRRKNCVSICNPSSEMAALEPQPSGLEEFFARLQEPDWPISRRLASYHRRYVNYSFFSCTLL